MRTTGSTGLSAEQVRLIRAGFEVVATMQTQAAELFYQRLFEIDPSLRPLFSGDMAEQGRKLMHAIGLLVRGLDDLRRLRPVLLNLGARHAGYGVEDQHYATVAQALIWTLEQGLGEQFGDAEKAAWVALYGLVSAVMRDGAASYGLAKSA